MRFDRLITLRLVQPWRNLWLTTETHSKYNEPGTPNQEPGTKNQELCSPIPILMYHSISGDPEPGVSPYYRVCTSPATFARQMQLLSDLGYHGVSLEVACREFAIRNHTHAASLSMGKEQSTALQEPHTFCSQLPSLETEPHDSKLAILTFDDGFRDFFTDAWPILQKHQFSATMFLPTACIGDVPRQFEGRNCLTWSDIAALHQAGIEFGSHTVNHPKLVELPHTQVATELRDSKAAIEDHLRHSVDAFCYPYAFPSQHQTFVQRLTDTLVTCGYTTCATTQIGSLRVTGPHQEHLDRLLKKAKSRPVGTNSQLPAPNSQFGYTLFLPRLPINNCDDNVFFEAKLSGAYDWMLLPQKCIKSFKQFYDPS